MITPRHILAATISCAALAAACADDISSTSGDTLSAAEFASMSAARHDLVMAIYGGAFPLADFVATASQATLDPDGPIFSRTIPCPAGGSVTTSTETIVLRSSNISRGWSSTGSHAVADCAVTWDDGATWTFASHGLEWTHRHLTTQAPDTNRFFSSDDTVKGPLSWSRDDKQGGCLVDLTLRARVLDGIYDSLTVRGQACGRRVHLAFSY